MADGRANSQRQMIQDIHSGKVKTVAHVLFWHLGSWSRNKQDVRADADVVLVRTITGTTLVPCVFRFTIRVVIERAVVVIVVTMFVRVNTLLSGIGRLVVTTRMQCRPATTESEVLYDEGNEDHE